MWKNVLLFWLTCCLCISIVYNIASIHPKGSKIVEVTKPAPAPVHNVSSYETFFNLIDYVVYTGDQKLKYYLKSCGALECQLRTSQNMQENGVYFVCLNNEFKFDQDIFQLSHIYQNIQKSHIQWSHIVFEGDICNDRPTLFQGLSLGTINTMDVYLYNNGSHLSNQKFIFVQHMENTQTYTKPLCLAMIEGCIKREPSAVKQCKWLYDMDGIESFYVVGSENQRDITVDIVSHKITVPCKDNYLNLCQKSYYLYKTADLLINNNSNFDNVKCVLKTDDDIVIKNNVLSWMKMYMDQYMYWGNVRHKKAHASNHFIKRSQESISFRRELEQLYPQLLHHKVWVDQVSYTNGGCTIVHKDALCHIVKNHDIFPEMPEQYILEQYKHKDYIANIPAFEDVCVGMALSRANIQPQHVNIKPVFHWEGL